MHRIYIQIKIFIYTAIKRITKRRMIIDVTGVLLNPGNNGRDCCGNGEHFNRKGKLIESCCDECDYMICCYDEYNIDKCKDCRDKACPRAGKTNVCR